MSDSFVLSVVRNWVASVVFQGQRVLDLQASSAPPAQSDDFFAWAKDRQNKPDFTHIEDHFFVTAVSKSVEWIVEAHNRGVLSHKLTEPFLIAAGHGALVRNIREHFIEYLNGGGRQRKHLQARIDINGGESTALIDASSVIITNEGRLIGGRLNVQQLMREADVLQCELASHLA